jgi:hemolysin III
MDGMNFREPVSAWSHLVWLVLSLPATLLLWRLSRGDRLKRIGVIVFGVTLALCYGASALYHAVRTRDLSSFAIADHIGIYVFIAGTATPIALVVFRGWWRAGVLGGMWGMALLGAVLRLTTHISVLQLTGCYLLMGWLGCTSLFELARRLPGYRVRLILLGGAFYSIGAVINGVGWPVLVPRIFGSHELFHLFVMAGSGFHYYFMIRAVLPYKPAVSGPRPTSSPSPPTAPSPTFPSTTGTTRSSTSRKRRSSPASGRAAGRTTPSARPTAASPTSPRWARRSASPSSRRPRSARAARYCSAGWCGRCACRPTASGCSPRSILSLASRRPT